MSTLVLYILSSVLFFGYFDLSYGLRTLKVIPGVPSVKYTNQKYIENVMFNVRRHGRKSDYITNIVYTSKHTWANHNVSLHLIFYEFLHNEYKRSFIEMHYNLCDMILKDIFVGGIVRRAGLTTCPIPPGTRHLMNMTFNEEFPSVWPFEKGKGELIIQTEPAQTVIVRGDLSVTFKQTY